MPPLWASSRLAATRVASHFLGEGRPRRLGFVHSTFEASLNLMVEGALIHVGDDLHPLSCLGLSVDHEAMAGLLFLLRRGDRAVLRDGSVVLYARETTIFLDYRMAECVETAIPRLGNVQPRDLLAATLAPEKLRVGIGLPHGRELAATLDSLSRVAGGLRGPEGLSAPIDHLVGRGRGLTPSGDDLLAGFGTALWARSREGLLAGFPAGSLEGRTTDVSVAYLRAMLAGHANEDYVGLVASLRDQDPIRCRSWVDAVLSVGHTSGHDSLLGFVVGLGLIDLVGGPQAFVRSYVITGERSIRNHRKEGYLSWQQKKRATTPRPPSSSR